jgi:hypothetical protein
MFQSSLPGLTRQSILLARERVSFLWNRNTLSILGLAHVLVGEPASTSPEHALMMDARVEPAHDGK